MPREIRMLLAAGGTGGICFQGWRLLKRHGGKLALKSYSLAPQQRIEKEMIPRLGFALQLIPAEQLRGRNWRGMAPLAMGGIACRSEWLASGAEFRPRCDLQHWRLCSGADGAGRLVRRIPCVLLEPNAIPGMTNRWLGRLATKICVGFPQTAAFFPARKRSVQEARYDGSPVLSSASVKPVPH